MAQILIRNLDDEALETLREQARRTGRSLEATVRMLIEDEARREKNRQDFPKRWEELRKRLPDYGTDQAGELRKIGRP